MKFRDVRVSFNFGVGQFRDTIGENDRSVCEKERESRSLRYHRFMMYGGFFFENEITML